jgi:single-strand DNA-binding protein
VAGNFNKIILVGRLTRDPEIKYTPQGTQLAKFGLAVSRAMSKNGETDFFNIVAWQKLAEICGQYLKKGKLVLIEGEVQTRSYETQDGQKRTAFEIVARNMQMLGSRNEEGGASYQGSESSAPSKKSQDVEELSIDEIDIDEFDAEDMPF